MNKHIKEKIINWLDKNWDKKRRLCDICNHQSWNMAEDIVSCVPVFEYGYMLKDGRMYPQILLTCDNCCNVKYFNIVKMGINYPCYP